MSSYPTVSCLGDGTVPLLVTTSFQGVVESNIFPEPSPLQAEQPQLPPPLLIGLVLQSRHQPHCPSLDPLQHLNILPELKGPEVDTALEEQHHQCRVQGKSHFPGPVGHTVPHAGQDAIGLSGHLGKLLAHVQFHVNKNPQVPFSLGTLQPPCPQPVVLHGVVVAKVQDLALDLVEPHVTGFSPSLQAIQVSLENPLAFQQINTPPQLSVIRKFANGRLNLLIQIIQMLNRTGCNTDRWETPLGAGCQLDAASFTTTLWAWPSTQFLTQQRVHLSKTRAASFFRSMQWKMVSNALLKCCSFGMLKEKFSPCH
ncbi:hypothetical protein WISP_88023 [Willisornis vidua]|uniref:Uncharacterized protein n=1 Tax=Willisornis vidua TaxID=1566151 RepID=A0ABQ9D8F9_9PASS|nr:hypothetical protein WISP_88023 [Willisornis vidua]